MTDKVNNTGPIKINLTIVLPLSNFSSNSSIVSSESVIVWIKAIVCPKKAKGTKTIFEIVKTNVRMILIGAYNK